MASGISFLLDSGPLGLAVHPRPPAAFSQWFHALTGSEVTVVVPEICDYELRRELIRTGRQRSLQQLDELCASLLYQPITTSIMRRAATLWAEARRLGRPTASDAALDGDVILAATALEIAAAGEDALIITTNVHHLARYTQAATWQSVRLK